MERYLLNTVEDQPKVVKVKKGKKFGLSEIQALYPGSEWICKNYDRNHVKLIDEYFKPPLSFSQMGTTTKVFKFKALKRGNTEIVLVYCNFGREREPIRWIERKGYTVQID